MALHLAQSQQSTLTPVVAANPAGPVKPTELIRIPDNASGPSHLCVRNVDPVAIVYIKTGGGIASATDYGVVLNPGESYDWGGSVPRGVPVTALSTVDRSLVAVEANWCVLGEQ